MFHSLPDPKDTSVSCLSNSSLFVQKSRIVNQLLFAESAKNFFLTLDMHSGYKHSPENIADDGHHDKL